MIRWATLLLVWMIGSHCAFGAQITVTVDGVRDGRGTVRVALCSIAEFLKPTCNYVGQVSARGGRVLVRISNVPPGTYAAQAYQDANGNNILDRNWFGMPEEGLGFSHDPAFHFGPPSFADSAFNVTTDDQQISLRLRYF